MNKLLTIVLCLLVAVVSLFTSFAMKSNFKKERDVAIPKQRSTLQAELSLQASDEELDKANDRYSVPVWEGEPEPERYVPEGYEEIKTYFTNTDQIDTGDILPLKAQMEIAERTQEFLLANGLTAGEVRLIDESLVVEADGVSFLCELPADSGAILEVGYSYMTGSFTFRLEG